jgi:Glycosyltransferase family 9 (heptosyltransferase)
MNEYKQVFLLRAFGDFIIAIQLAVINKSGNPIHFIASKHFEPLFKALHLTLPPNFSIQFVEFNIRHNIMGCLTDRYLFSFNTIKELLSLKKFIGNNLIPGQYYLEHKKRAVLLSSFCGYQFKHIIDTQNVYQGYADFFSTSLDDLANISFDLKKSKPKILLIPDARQQKREIATSLINIINKSSIQMGFEMSVASFGNRINHLQADIHSLAYRNFKELIQLILQFDLIIGSDSMPIHMAQLLKKPHYIVYPKYVKKQFFTPFALKHLTYVTFEEIIEKQSFF